MAGLEPAPTKKKNCQPTPGSIEATFLTALLQILSEVECKNCHCLSAQREF
jgi:hypothetical protein